MIQKPRRVAGYANPVDGRQRMKLTALNGDDRFRIAQLVQSARLDNRRWTVDTPEDFEFVSRVFYMLYPTNPRFEQADILALSIERLAA